MANIKSQKKRIITNEKARMRNRAVRSELKTAVRVVREAVEAQDGAKAYAAALDACRLLDRAASKGVIHKRQAANRKSGVMKLANTIVTPEIIAEYTPAPKKEQAATGNKKAAAKAATAVKATTKAAEAVVEEVKGAAVKEVEPKAEKAVEADIKEVAAAAKETVKDTGAKVVDKAKEVTKKVEKTVKEKVAEVKAAAADPEVYVQYQGNESNLAVITERIKKQYVEEGHKESDIKSLKIYLKPEDASAYYVINDNNSGKVFLF